MRRLIPYPVVAGDVSLEVREVRLDDIALPYAMVSVAQRIVALHEVERGRWETARLSVRLHAPQHELESGPWEDVTCFAVHSERRTNVRTSTRLQEEAPGIWSGDIVLYSDRHVGRVQLTGQLVGTVGGVEGRMIGATEDTWTVDLQARTPVKSNTIKTVWADFGDEDGRLYPFRSDPWMVEAIGEEPVLYLNKGFEGLVSLIESTRTVDRSARDAVAAQIAQDVWTVLFNAAVYAIDPDSDAPEWPGGWREATLKRLLPDVFPDRSPDDALSELANRRRDGDGGGDFQANLLHATAKQARLPRNLGGFIRTLRRTGQENE
ncbi:hypothetical protein Acsp03_63660 [Actinomadura sp. NBRC 104412]|uniref:hypothetical protein n=1 Tax=Actinomadura sp. NBRC 104412 TaxID=3032203 RepID=UPI0024A342F1|nr:hypothetical protein [Actinomadura sp. NBRC 104412]GLZ08900.1 hypothetical protein Acsp03_63660 [Actinomadura sp. NBRC 104412]